MNSCFFIPAYHHNCNLLLKTSLVLNTAPVSQVDGHLVACHVDEGAGADHHQVTVYVDLILLQGCAFEIK